MAHIFFGGLTVVLAAIHLLVRAPCPPNYVRLFDVGWPLLGLGALVASSGVIPLMRRRSWPLPADVLLAAAGMIGGLAATVHLVLLRDTCWTW